MRAVYKPIAGVPILALVDAFVGGTAVLLIMIVLSPRPQPTDGMQPEADLTLECRNEVVSPVGALPVWMDQPPLNMTIQGALEWAASVPPPDSLVLRMRIETSPKDMFCLLYVNDALGRWSNDTAPSLETSIGPRAILAPVLVLMESDASAPVVNP